jgi:predicted Fe-Mo cluster-binding NifX family protein
MILIPVESDEKTIAQGFRKADKFVFIDKKTGIMVQENHFKSDKSPLFFTHFKTYNVETLYVKNIGYKTYLKLIGMGIEVLLIAEDVTYYTHIDPSELISLTDSNAEIYCTLGHHKQSKENK